MFLFVIIFITIITVLIILSYTSEGFGSYADLYGNSTGNTTDSKYIYGDGNIQNPENDYNTNFQNDPNFNYNTDMSGNSLYDSNYLINNNALDRSASSNTKIIGSSDKILIKDQYGNLVEVPNSEIIGLVSYYETGSHNFGMSPYSPLNSESSYDSKLTGTNNFKSFNEENLNYSGICKKYQYDPIKMEQACNSLSNDTCSATNCCVLLGGSKCVSGDVLGPKMKSNYSDIFLRNKDFYYYQGNCHGNCPRNDQTTFLNTGCAVNEWISNNDLILSSFDNLNSIEIISFLQKLKQIIDNINPYNWPDIYNITVNCNNNIIDFLTINNYNVPDFIVKRNLFIFNDIAECSANTKQIPLVILDSMQLIQVNINNIADDIINSNNDIGSGSGSGSDNTDSILLKTSILNILISTNNNIIKRFKYLCAPIPPSINNTYNIKNLLSGSGAYPGSGIDSVSGSGIDSGSGSGIDSGSGSGIDSGSGSVSGTGSGTSSILSNISTPYPPYVQIASPTPPSNNNWMNASNYNWT